MVGTTSSPRGTGRLPLGQKSFWTSTTSRTPLSPIVIAMVAPPAARRGQDACEHPPRLALTSCAAGACTRAQAASCAPRARTANLVAKAKRRFPRINFALRRNCYHGGGLARKLLAQGAG